MPDLNEHDHKISMSNKLITSLTAGALAGALAKTVIAPLDRAKINFQVSQTPYSYRGVLQFLLDSVRHHGALSLWRGNSATMARVVPYAAIQFTAHEQWKRALNVDTTATSQHNTKGSAVRRYMAGSLAGVTATTFTYPLDLARARMAVTDTLLYKNISHVFFKILKQEGGAALYRGFVPTLLGVIPYAGTSFFTYETLKKFHLDKNVSGDRSLSAVERLIFGAIAGLLGQTSSYPLDIVRRRMQTAVVTGNSCRYATICSTLLILVRTEGIIHGLFKGMTLNWIKGPISVSVSFTTFDSLLLFLRKLPILHDS